MELSKKKQIKNIKIKYSNKIKGLTKKKIKFMFWISKFLKGKYFGKVNVEKNNINIATLKKKRKTMLFLSQQLKSYIQELFFKDWIKGQVIPLTIKQQWLLRTYNQYQKFLLNDRKDFFKTLIGETLTLTHLNADVTGLWLPRRSIRKRTGLKKVPLIALIPINQHAFDLIASHQRGWLFENLLAQKKPETLRYFPLVKINTAFQNHWKQQQKTPWLDPLIFKRWAFFGMLERYRKETGTRAVKMKAYLRKKNPRAQKRNKLYLWRNKLLFNFWHKKIIQKTKAKRIKQVISKIYRPFYGHLSQKQFDTINKKIRKKKSKSINRNEVLLSRLENRLDVVVYRLNLAPTILWARRLIWEGSIFVNNPKQSQGWISMHAALKKLAFPLKLRDPKNLYKTIYWNPNKKLSKYKFLLKPTIKIDYLVQPEDLIQFTPALTLNQFKSNSSLFNKPLTTNLMAMPKMKYSWNQATRGPQGNSFFKWQQPNPQVTSAMVLFNPEFTDLHETDRVQESFLRWVTL
jgi:ribosomal protein S4